MCFTRWSPRNFCPIPWENGWFWCVLRSNRHGTPARTIYRTLERRESRLVASRRLVWSFSCNLSVHQMRIWTTCVSFDHAHGTFKHINTNSGPILAVRKSFGLFFNGIFTTFIVARHLSGTRTLRLWWTHAYSKRVERTITSSHTDSRTSKPFLHRKRATPKLKRIQWRVYWTTKASTQHSLLLS